MGATSGVCRALTPPAPGAVRRTAGQTLEPPLPPAEGRGPLARQPGAPPLPRGAHALEPVDEACVALQRCGADAVDANVAAGQRGGGEEVVRARRVGFNYVARRGVV